MREASNIFFSLEVFLKRSPHTSHQKPHLAVCSHIAAVLYANLQTFK
jgi:hypothetical protein